MTKELQVENGNYTRIVNRVIDELIKARLLGAEFAVCLFIIRKTYGFNKTSDEISLSQFQNGTNLSRPTVVKALQNLQKKNIIKLMNTGNSKSCSNSWSFNKYYEKWELVKTPELVKYNNSTSKVKALQLVKTPLSTKDNTKDKQKTIEKQVSNFYPQDNPTSWGILDSMYNYELIDENGNPFKKKRTRITKQENEMLISVGFMWQSMCSEYLDLEKEDIPMKNLYYPIRATYDRTKWKKEDFKKLFEYFFLDKDIKTESKLSFDLCLSEKYVAKFKLKSKLQAKQSSGTFDIIL